MSEVGIDVQKVIRLLNQGELVAIPTETVYGLSANALDARAVAKIFDVKGRPQFDPLIVHISSANQMIMWAKEIPERAMKLADRFWPGPLTLVLKKKNTIPDLVTAGLDTVGLRCPRHPLTLDLLKRIPFPLAAPSANPFGYVSPTLPVHVQAQLGEKIPYILDGGPCEVGIESTIIGFGTSLPEVYRLGGIGLEEIERTIGPVALQLNSISSPRAPGQLKSHYAPLKKLVVGNIHDLLKKYSPETTGVLSFRTDYKVPHQFILSANGNLNVAAQNLFSALRFFDASEADLIITEEVPDNGLGKAINDRLRRAAS